MPNGNIIVVSATLVHVISLTSESVSICNETKHLVEALKVVYNLRVLQTVCLYSNQFTVWEIL